MTPEEFRDLARVVQQVIDRLEDLEGKFIQQEETIRYLTEDIDTVAGQF
jgi:uncharacterized coiled-coil protein SlyX